MGKSIRIFIVEDEDQSRAGLVDLISSLDPEAVVVGQAANGRQALSSIVHLRPDLVFTDIRMPIMDGLALIRAVRERVLDQPIEFVITSAFTDFSYAKAAMSLGVREYLVKPVDADSIAAILRHVRQAQCQNGKAVGPGPVPPVNQSAGPTPFNLAAMDQLPDKSKELESKDDLHPLIRKVLPIIAERYASTLNLEEISSQLSITPEYFSYLFHRNMGINFSGYLKNFRVAMACQLFCDEHYKVYEVAERVGYMDTKYFCRVFRDVTGLTPTEYIRRYNLGNKRSLS